MVEENTGGGKAATVPPPRPQGRSPENLPERLTRKFQILDETNPRLYTQITERASDEDVT